MATTERNLSSVVTIGGKGASLSSPSLHSIATNLSQLQIDSSSLDKLSPKHRLSSNPNPQISPNPNPKPTQDQSRASLVILLTKLLTTTTGIRPTLPLLIVETLNQNLDLKTLDFSSPLPFLNTLLKLNGKTLDRTGVTDGELLVLENSFFPWIGVGGLLDYTAAVLSTTADAVASLSCEALKADMSGVYGFMDAGDGLSVKDVANVASDLKVLLVGSKLVGKVKSGYVSQIPKVHGNLREAVSLVHSKTRVEMNASVKAGDLVSEGSSGFWDVLATTFLHLGNSLLALGKSSLGRARLMVDSIPNVELRMRVLEVFEASLKENFASFEDLKNRYVISLDNLNSLYEICNLLVSVRYIVAWEAMLALFVLDINDQSDKSKGSASSSSKVQTNGVNPNAGANPNAHPNTQKKSEKKKRVTLGKGTAVIRQLLQDKLKSESGALVENFESLNTWAGDLSSFFDPKDLELGDFLKKVKEIAETNEARRLPKIPKGTRDFSKEQMVIREKAFSTIQKVFKKHGATALDTPVFELRETLMGKYGEDSKLIYDLADQGGELCSLRYDLTVPFARHVAMNGLTSFKRYQIAKVYRRDNPSKGRYREFYQCDFDIAGQYEMMGPDFEVIKILTELLDDLNIGDYEIKLNHRKLLDGMLEICGVHSEKFRTICSSIDKLDKQPFEQIKKEMVEEKGLTVDTADKIGDLVKKRGHPLEILSELKQDGSPFMTNKDSMVALDELGILFKSLEKSKCIRRVVFDLSLARGLDYYTGLIFEAVFTGGATQVGSIAAGGRYDNLIGNFGTKQVPAVGVSLGIERVLTIMEEQLTNRSNQVIRATETEVLVGILGDDLSHAAELASELWGAQIKTEYMVHKKVMKLIEKALDSKIPWMVMEGEKERNEGVVKLKNIETKEEFVVARSRIVEELQNLLISTS